MTHQNKAREALEWFNSHYCKSECSHYETIRRALTLLERLEGVDRVALRESFKKGIGVVDETKCLDTIKLWHDAARIVADVGE